ncbi:MAG: hypothetical protein NWR72_07390 [Bacteroidia bacterium]|nr:hypothetical protein [Bacteroidia bacterium]
MKKRKKVVKQAPLSIKRYLKESARKLPISHCYCTEGWEESGIAQVLVCRKKQNGTFLIGIFLIDTFCLGIKSADVKNNEDWEQVAFLVNMMQQNGGRKMAEVPYEYAHNLIYGAEAFARDIGFMPDNDFALAQYVLEADTEDIPFIAFEFGKDGEPFYMQGPYDSVPKIMRVLAAYNKRQSKEDWFTDYEEV